MKFQEAQTLLDKLLLSVDKDELRSFLLYSKAQSDSMLSSLELSNDEIMVKNIQEELCNMLPQEAVFPSENIITPVVGENSDCEAHTTLHVDAFLYEDDTIDDLCEEGKLSRNYCTQCGSKQVTPLTFISHSTSVTQGRYIFQHVLPDLENKVVVDIGSRLGALLYMGYYFSNSQKIFGVEINKDFCEVQQQIVSKYQLQDRVQVINDDVTLRGDILENADVLILNNVFEFFASLDVQTRIWLFLRDSLRKTGAVLVVSPSLETSLQHLQTNIDIEKWVRPISSSEALLSANLRLFGSIDHDDSDLSDIHFYEVL